ncbi:MAG: Recombination protein RecR [Candidatus Nomurabacteria bacterium GW2011_GWA2_40_9]|uniref:Recombination protein RecR n=1 Tax=Candidatus Nomurabacteria bacterium GW2011_GWA2_40_9 TaxID=1618734 RepID=A0A0G0TUZ4_9BACT|nr:MAG: Recombination protein RecR [Candidatus Nomurabacteria bacterium GW2011_GWA2_40_9]
MDTIDKLTEIFKEFPGIGERQARRFVYFLMSRNSGYPENLAKTILDLKKDISQCRECFRFFVTHQNKDSVCEICTNPNINSDILMVIEKDSDLESVKKSRVYGGKYFILGGLVPIVEKNTKSYVRIEELKQKIISMNSPKQGFGEKLEEVILAFSLSPIGDHTDLYVREQIKNICEKNNIKISSLGRGLSTGTELEYSDNETLKNALKNRQ